MNSRPVVGAADRPPTDRKAKVVVPLPSTPLQPMFPGVPTVNPTPLLTQLAGLAVKKVPGRPGTILPSTVALSGLRTFGSTLSEIAKPLIALELKMFTATTNFVPTGPVNWAGVKGSHVVDVVRFVQTVPLGSARAGGGTEIMNSIPRRITHAKKPTLTRLMTLSPLLKEKLVYFRN